ncbi:MAG: right-handed parallel beta-helix repeat-containing protein [Acidimicrobiia bacterium]
MIRGVLLVGAGMFVFAGCSRAAAVDVENDLRGAIAAARPGTTLHLAGNEFQGPIVIDKPLRLIGSRGTVIVAPPDAPAITITNTEDVIVSNISIRGGESGVFVRSSVGVVLEAITITEAQWHGFFAHDAEVEITGCDVSRLQASKPQGIEIINSDSRPASIVSGCHIEGPVFEGIVSHVSEVTFANNVVTGASPRGIVITEMSVGSMTGNRVVDGSGSALFCGDMSRCSIIDNDIRGISAIPGGYRSAMGHGAVIHFHSTAYVEDLRTSDIEGDDLLVMLGSHLSEVALDR